MSDKIVLEGLEFHSFHGVFEEEKSLGARFVVDVEMATQISWEDRLDATVDYSKVYALVKQEVTEKRYDLIEALAHAVATRVLNEHPKVDQITVRVHKPHAPLPGVVRDVYVQVSRDRTST